MIALHLDEVLHLLMSQHIAAQRKYWRETIKLFLSVDTRVATFLDFIQKGEHEFTVGNTLSDIKFNATQFTESFHALEPRQHGERHQQWENFGQRIHPPQSATNLESIMVYFQPFSKHGSIYGNNGKHDARIDAKIDVKSPNPSLKKIPLHWNASGIS